MTAGNADYVKRILWNAGRQTIDEIVVFGCDVHIEQMDDDEYSIAITQGARLWQGTFVAVEPSTLDFEESDGSSWEWDRDEEHAP